MLVTIRLVTVGVPAGRVEEACKPPATWRLPATVEEAWAINPPETVKAKTEVEAKFWTSRALPVWPYRARRARLMDRVEVAPTVRTALAETLEVPITTWSVNPCNSTIVPVSVKPETLEAEIAPHKRLPVLSVVKAEEPEQPVCNNWIDPPLNWMPLEKVEVAPVPVRFRLVAEMPPV